MQVTVHGDRCVTSGRCAFTAPDVFIQNDDGIVELLTDQPAADQFEAVRDAVYLCPASAIDVRER
jgi:ferredoxin